MSKLSMKAWLLPLGLLFAAMAHAGELPVSRDGYELRVEGQGPVVVVFESGFGQGASPKAVADTIRFVVATSQSGK